MPLVVATLRESKPPAISIRTDRVCARIDAGRPGPSAPNRMAVRELGARSSMSRAPAGDSATISNFEAIRASISLSAEPARAMGKVRAAAQVRETSPDHHLVVVNGNLYFRINRASLKVLERTPQDIGQARAYRDRRLVELGLKVARV